MTPLPPRLISPGLGSGSVCPRAATGSAEGAHTKEQARAKPSHYPEPGVALIAAVAANGVIGRGNRLPWRLPADLRRFKELTLGHALVMGRRTYESIGRPLPGRVTVVLTRDPAFAPPGVAVARNLDEALAAAAAACPGSGEVFVAGGAEVYAQALPRAGRLYLTRVEAEVEGDTRFPDFDPALWRLAAEERVEPGPPRDARASGEAGGEAPLAYRFEVWERI